MFSMYLSLAVVTSSICRRPRWILTASLKFGDRFCLT